MRFFSSILRAAVLLLTVVAVAQQPVATPEIKGGDISGVVLAGKTPLPGVVITAAHSITGRKVVTSTALDGSFTLHVPANGKYVVRAELAAFAPITQEVIFNAQNHAAKLSLELTLLSRVQQTEGGDAQQALAQAMAGRGIQGVNLNADMAGLAQGPENGGAPTGAEGAALPAAASGDVSTESVSFSGNTGRSTEGIFSDEMQDRIAEMRDRIASGQGVGGGTFQMAGGGNIEIRGGPPGGGGGGGAPMIIMMGPGGIQMGGGGRGRFNVNQPHGFLTYSTSNSALDAAPYSLTGEPQDKPDYAQHRYGASIGGPLKIPKLYNGSKTFYFFNWMGSRSTNPFSQFGTVPTAAERAGDFSALPIVIFDPQTGLPFAGNVIPSNRIRTAATGLLAYVPLPNQNNGAQNFSRLTSTDNNSDNINFRINHNFSGGGPFGGGGGGARRGSNARSNAVRNNIHAGFNWRNSTGEIANFSPFFGGLRDSSGLNVDAGWMWGKGRLNNRVGFGFNHNRSESSNLFAGVKNVAGDLGIVGPSTDPLDWGAPVVSLTHFTGVRDVNPSLREDNALSFNEFVSWNHGKHNIRVGGDFRRMSLDLRSASNPRGTFTFTGAATAQIVGGKPVAGTGYDLADFLLGIPQQAAIQAGNGSYSFTANAWNVFVQDDWRINGKFSLNLGLRYEYISPYTEENNRLVNLDANGDFTAVASVQPDQNGPFTGQFPAALIDPDRNNFAPRVGIAYRAAKKTVIRGGYGINYNLGAYGAFVQQLAFQPPFATTQTAVRTGTNPITLENAFSNAAPNAITNNFGVDRNYRLGYVQNWNLDVQQELPGAVVLSFGYNGAKGTRLEMQRAPNRGPNGFRIPNVQAFTWVSSEGASILHSGTVRLRKRMRKGFMAGGSYTFSKSIDNASTIGGGAATVAQNDLDLAAERGLSSFDQRHRLSAEYVFELPFGMNRRWLNREGAASKLLGEWSFSGNMSFASGTPFTARVIGAFADVANGTNGTLRANYLGQPITIENPTVAQWFNTAAFVAPASGSFGNARRNMIPGPSSIRFDMSVGKNIPIKEGRAFEVRASASNVFNTPVFTAIDTTVNSPTYGRVVNAGPMRTFSLSTRFRF